MLLLFILALVFSAILCYDKDNGEGGFSMAIRYKVDILAELKQRGYSSTRILEDHGHHLFPPGLPTGRPD